MSQALSERATKARVIIRFLRGWEKYNAGEVAGFAPAFAAKLLGRGIAEKLGEGTVGVPAKLSEPKQDLQADAQGKMPPTIPMPSNDTGTTPPDPTAKYSGMNVAQLRDELVARQIPFDSNAKRADLIDLLAGADVIGSE